MIESLRTQEKLESAYREFRELVEHRYGMNDEWRPFFRFVPACSNSHPSHLWGLMPERIGRDFYESANLSLLALAEKWEISIEVEKEVIDTTVIGSNSPQYIQYYTIILTPVDEEKFSHE